MATGQYYFARVLASETTFLLGHQRVDDNVFAWELQQSEGEFASLKITILNPRVPPLKLGEKVHCWFAVDCGGGQLIKFFGRLVAMPTNLVGSTIEYEYHARPPDYETQKAALAESMKDLPFYDRVFIDPQAEDDPDHVLEGYGVRWHIPRDSLTVTVSDELSGEDGVLDFGPEDHDFDGLDIRVEGVQKVTAIINAELPWTQTGTGGLDLTEWITENWINDVEDVEPGVITSYTLNDQNWPRNGAGMGNGWSVQEATCSLLYPVDVNHHSASSKTINNWASGSKTILESTINVAYIGAERLTTGTVTTVGTPSARFGSYGSPPPGSVTFPAIVTEDKSEFAYGDDGNGGREVVSFSRNFSHTLTVIPLFHLRPTLIVQYEANRPFTERWNITLTADVQPVMSIEDDAGIMRLNEMRGRNLSEPMEDSSDGEIPIGDSSRRSYVNSARGQQSLMHVLCVARAALRRAARICNVTIAPHLHMMPAVTLRKSALITDGPADRIPGGSALGKIIAYSLALNGDNGSMQCSVTVGCAVGRGGTVTAVTGTGLYVDAAALGPEIQEFTGRVVTLDDDDDLGFTIPPFNPQDDGLAFESDLTIEDVLEEDLTIENPPGAQRTVLLDLDYHEGNFIVNPSPEQRQQAVEERNEALSNALSDIETRAVFKLRSLDGEFEPGYDIDVTDLKIPRGINLEGAA